MLDIIILVPAKDYHIKWPFFALDSLNSSRRRANNKMPKLMVLMTGYYLKTYFSNSISVTLDIIFFKKKNHTN